MKVLILGGGRIGRAVVDGCYSHGCDITLIEKDDKEAEYLQQHYDVLVERGDAVDYRLLERCNIDKTDVVAAVTDDSEINLLAGIIAKKMGAGYVTVKISDALYDADYENFVETELGIDKAFNPGRLVADRLLKDIENNPDIGSNKRVIIVGAVNSALFLANDLVKKNYSVLLVVDDKDSYDAIADELAEEIIVKIGDVKDQDVFDEINIEDAGAFIAVTTREADNVVIAKYADTSGVPYTAAMASVAEIVRLGKNLGVDNVISPKDLSDFIVNLK